MAHFSRANSSDSNEGKTEKKNISPLIRRFQDLLVKRGMPKLKSKQRARNMSGK